MFLIILFIALFIGLIGLAIRLAWGFLKFITGVGLFLVCPILFIVLLATHTLNFGIVLLILLGICGVGFGRS